MYLTLKTLHLIFAVITISGFLLRGYWMIVESDRLELKTTRIAPHVIDTLFLATGIAMLFLVSMNPFTQPWLVAKFVGLVVYVVLGTIAIKRGRTRTHRVLAFVGAVATFAYIVGVGFNRSALSWIAFLPG